MTLSASGPQLFIELHNQFSFPCLVESRRLKQTMLISFLAHGIIKREHSYQLPRANTSLTEFLELSFSPLTNHLLEDLHFHDLPGKRGSFSLIYQDLYAEESQQKCAKNECIWSNFPLTNAFASERISYRKFRRNSKEKNFF